MASNTTPRKSMIEPTLPRGAEVAGEGILERIIAHDREQSGRPAPEDAEQEETNVTTLQRSHEETPEAPNARTILIKAEEESTDVKDEPSVPTSSKAKAKQSSIPSIPAAEGLEKRQAAALSRALEDEIAVVTVRAPQKLNTYIDRYVERINRITPKRRYRKQDAVAEMFAWFYASHPMPPAPDEEDL